MPKVDMREQPSEAETTKPAAGVSAGSGGEAVWE